MMEGADPRQVASGDAPLAWTSVAFICVDHVEVS